jgi:hypothetical protein
MNVLKKAVGDQAGADVSANAPLPSLEADHPSHASNEEHQHVDAKSFVIDAPVIQNQDEGAFKIATGMAFMPKSRRPLPQQEHADFPDAGDDAFHVWKTGHKMRMGLFFIMPMQ